MNAPRLPEGSERIAHWARMRGLAYQGHPNEEWFRAWEPFDTMNSGTVYFNSVSFAQGNTHVTLAEPWMAPEDTEPLDRTVLAFVSDQRFRLRAAARGGEHFNTRVSFLENAKMPTVSIGDPHWDKHMATFAASPSEADRAFPLGMRQALAHMGFSGHIEVRPGGMVLHFAGTKPTPEHYENLAGTIPKIMRSLG